MIDGIGRGGAGRIEPQRAGASQGNGAVRAAEANAAGGQANGIGGVVSALVAMGPPVDGEKVAALRAAIAEGRYKVDPDTIADRMIAAER